MRMSELHLATATEDLDSSRAYNKSSVQTPAFEEGEQRVERAGA